jgi:PAS domain-containing protein
MASDEAITTMASWYKIAINSLGDGVIAANTGGIVTFLDPAAERLFLARTSLAS